MALASQALGVAVPGLSGSLKEGLGQGEGGGGKKIGNAFFARFYFLHFLD